MKIKLSRTDNSLHSNKFIILKHGESPYREPNGGSSR